MPDKNAVRLIRARRRPKGPILWQVDASLLIREFPTINLEFSSCPEVQTRARQLMKDLRIPFRQAADPFTFRSGDWLWITSSKYCECEKDRMGWVFSAALCQIPLRLR